MRALWRLFRKNKPADPFARFTETYGMRAAAAGSQAAPFGNGYRRAENASGRPSSPTFEEEPHSLGILRRDDSRATALKTLGVVEAAGAEEISAAYRKLARTHHPDKVAKLKPEVREYSEQRMKEINAAYALLRQRGDGSASSRRWLS
jgi:DnaJ-domain-containing protein 1